MSVQAIEGLVIGGERVDAAEGRTFEVVNPATATTLATVAEGGVEDVNRAVAAAVQAYAGWGALSPVTRGRRMHRFAALVEEHAEALALLECQNVGMPISDARGQLGMIIDVIRYYAGAVDKFFGHTVPVERDGVALTFREPIGVVGLITPWNFPLNIANWKIAPAIAAGNTVVLKPASLTPLSVLRYAELAVEAGIPEGVLNVVPGPGGTSGRRWSSTPMSARSASPARPRSARGSRGGPRRRSSASPSSWAGSRPASSSPTPTSRRSAGWRRTRCSRTAGRIAARGRG